MLFDRAIAVHVAKSVLQDGVFVLGGFAKGVQEFLKIDEAIAIVIIFLDNRLRLLP
jgi:hypothetical protein